MLIVSYELSRVFQMQKNSLFHVEPMYSMRFCVQISWLHFYTFAWQPQSWTVNAEFYVHSKLAVQYSMLRVNSSKIVNSFANLSLVKM